MADPKISQIPMSEAVEGYDLFDKKEVQKGVSFHDRNWGLADSSKWCLKHKSRNHTMTSKGMR